MASADAIEPDERSLRGATTHVALLAASAVLLGLAFPPVGVGWLAHWALVPATVLAVRSAAPGKLACLTWLVFLAWWLIMAAWLRLVTVEGYVAACVVMAAYPALALPAVRWLDRRWRLPMIVALPLVWVGLEFVRGRFLAGGFGWLALAHSQAPFEAGHAAPRLAQVADLLGEHTVGLIVAMTNGLVADLCLRRWTRPWLGSSLAWSVAAWLGVVGAAWLYGGFRIAGVSDPIGATHLGVIQTDQPQDNRNAPTLEQEQADWAKLVALTRAAAAHDPAPSLIVWPETMVPAPLNEASRDVRLDSLHYHSQIEELARELNTPLLVGASAAGDWIETTDRRGRAILLPGVRYNSSYLYLPEQGQVGRFDKMHRVPFGEYIPWVDGWPWLRDIFFRLFVPYDFDYTIQPGAAVVRFDIPWGSDDAPRRGDVYTIATPICFEDTVGRVCRRMVYDIGPGGALAKRVDVLVNQTNDGWYPDTAQGPQHLQIAVFRCIENRVPMARSVNTGSSGFIDSRGRIGPIVTDASGYAVHQVLLDHRLTLYGRVGDGPMTVLAALAGLLVATGFFRADRRIATPMDSSVPDGD